MTDAALIQVEAGKHDFVATVGDHRIIAIDGHLQVLRADRSHSVEAQLVRAEFEVGDDVAAGAFAEDEDITAIAPEQIIVASLAVYPVIPRAAVD